MTDELTQEVREDFRSGDVSVLLFSSVERKLLLLEEGVWVLDVWIPQSTQGPWKDHRILGRVSGNALRCVFAQITYGDTCEQICVESTKECKSHVIHVKGEPLQVNVSFSTRAFLFPVHFEYALRRTKSCVKECNKDGKVCAGMEQEREVDATGEEDEDCAVQRELSLVAAELDPMDTVEDPLRGIEKRFRKLAFEDKLRVANMVMEAEAKGWPSLSGACAAHFDNSLGVNEMKRCSPFKLQAHEQGLIRPFLLLVSLHPGRRYAWATALGLNLARHESFGDAHWEAYEILTNFRKGVMPRAMRTFREQLNPMSRKLDWYQLLHRVLSRVMSTKWGLFQRLGHEKMPEDLQEELEEAKVDKSLSRELSARQGLCKAPESLENLFARTFLLGSADELFDAAGYLNTDELPLDEEDAERVRQDKVSKDELMERLVEIVEENPEFKELAANLHRHGVTDKVGAAFLVLASFHKFLPINYKSAMEKIRSCKTQEECEACQACGFGVNDAWDEQWGSKRDMFSPDFREKVAAKIKQEGRSKAVKGSLQLAVPAIVGALTASPVSVVLFSRAVLKNAFPELPASVASVLSGLILQRYWLAVSDIGISDFYPPQPVDAS